MGRLKQSFCLPAFCDMADWRDVQRIMAGAKKGGFDGCEVWGIEAQKLAELHRLAMDIGLPVVNMVGHNSLGDGLNRPENHRRIRDEITASLELARRYGIANLICFSGNRYGCSDEECLHITADGLALVKDAAEAAGVNLNLELLNSKVDHPGYQCDHTAWGVKVVRRVGSPRVKLLYDIYHMQIMEGDLCRTISANIAFIGHFHTAGNPGRHDLDDEQEICYPAVARAIRDAGFTGYVAHEFWAKSDKLAALLDAWRIFASE